MDVQLLADSYGGLSRAVVQRAQEYWRLTRAKKSAALDHTAGAVACLVVAARALDATVDKDRLAKCASASMRHVDATMRKVVDAVGVVSVIKTTPAALCIKFGCEALTEIVNGVFDEYRKFLARQAAANKMKKTKHPLGPVGATVDDKDPVFAAACVYAASKYAKMNVNREKLLEAVCGNAKLFDTIVSSIEKQCATSFSGAIVNRKRRRASAEEVSRKLAALQKQERQEEEEQRMRMRQNEAPTPTASQQKLMQKLWASRKVASPGQSPGSARKVVAVASSEEYAEWRAQALAFMQDKKERERQEAAAELRVITSIEGVAESNES